MKAKSTLKRFKITSITAAILSAIAISQPIYADEAYWRDSAGGLIRSGAADCVKTGDWMKDSATADCDNELAARLRAEKDREEQQKAEAARLAKLHAEEQARAEAERLHRAEEARKPVKVTLNAAGTALFTHNSSNLSPAARVALNKLAERIKTYEQLDSIRVTGHTDSLGTTQYNQWLSERRAETVKKHLVSQGLAPEKIFSAGKGESQPVAGNATDAERAKNRRVEIEIRGQRTEMKP